MPDTAPRFICDSMLGRLAKSLRMLGFDTLYARSITPQALMQSALVQQRIILTCRNSFLINKHAPAFFFIRSNAPHEQLSEVISAWNIKKAALRPFTLCLHCNALLESLDKESAAGHVPDYVFTTIDHFAACPCCSRVYWQGSHYTNMADRITKIID